MLLLWLLALPVAALQCYNESGLVIPSVYGAQCVECDAQGYLTAGGCVCYVANVGPNCLPIPRAQQVTVTSTCGSGFCHDQDSVCVLSAPPVQCSECGGGGYIDQQSFCQCYSTQADPNDACTVVGDAAFTYAFNMTVTNSNCSCFASWDLGWFAGPGCNQCLLEVLGPTPNQALLNYECNTYGGQNPVLNATTDFSICWGHGTWNPLIHNCTCDPTWRAEDTFLHGIGGVEVWGCLDCAEWWGPPPAESVSACSVVWTPDPVDGVLRECSGHGVFVDGACFCEANWALVQLDAVQTCAVCAPGFLLPLCGGTAAPTRSPTRSPSASPILQSFLLYYDLPGTVDPSTLGNAAAMEQRCLSLLSTCTIAVPLLCFNDTDLNQFAYDPSLPITLQGIAVGGQVIAPGERDIFANYAALIASHGLDDVAYGCNATYAWDGHNCNDFSSSTADYTFPGLAPLTAPCTDAIIGFACLCVAFNGSQGPLFTYNPTASPSLRPV